MICPKCGFEQPESPECARCGIIISRYKGRVFGAVPVLPSGPPPPPPGYGPPPPPPPMTAGGTVYGDPAAAPVPAPPAARKPEFRGLDLGMGDLLNESFSVYFSNLIPFVLISALGLSPLFVFMSYISTLPMEEMLIFTLIAIPVQLICSQVVAAGVAYGVYQHLRGGSPGISDCLRAAFSSFFSVFSLAIVYSLAIAAGLLLCVAPGILLAVRWAVATPVMVEESPGILEALRRSSYLTEGYRGAVFGVLFVLGASQQLGSKFLELAIDDLGTFLVVSSVIDLVTTGLFSTAAAVMYYRLRSAKEAIDVDEISSVFA